MGRMGWLWAAGLAAVVAAPASAGETPEYGGTLTYMIPADAPPSFDAHREETYATIHSAAPFYSTLIRINPNDPSSTSDIVCDLCTAIPQPTDNGKTWTFKIRQGVKFHNGDPLTAADVAASLNEIALPPKGVLSPRSDNFIMVKDIEAPIRPPSSFISSTRRRLFFRRSPTPSTGSTRKRSSTRIPTGTSSISWALAHSNSPATKWVNTSRGRETLIITIRGCPTSMVSSEFTRRSKRCKSTRFGLTGRRPSSAAIRHRPSSS